MSWPVDWSDFDLLEFERGPCYGPCPIYKIKVSRDGSVHWNGELFVKESGERTWQLSPARMRKLREHIKGSGFGLFKMEYEGMTDCSSSTTTITAKSGARKRVHFYHGQAIDTTRRLGIYNLLTAMENGIDRIVGTRPYVGGREMLDRV